MPIAKFQMPDGRVARFEVPEGTTPEQAQALIAQQMPAMQPQQPQQPQQEGGIGQTLGNIGAGALRGVAGIGATIAQPFQALAGGALGNNAQMRKNLDVNLQNMGAQPESMAYQGGKLASEIGATLPVGGGLGALVKGVSQSPKALQIAEALKTGGNTLGSKLASGAVTGGAQAGLIDPSQAGLGAALGTALPIAGGIVTAGRKALGATTGVGDEALLQAYKAGKTGGATGDAFVGAMRGQTNMDDVLNSAKQNLSAMGQQKQEAYRQGMAGIKSDKTVLDLSGVEDAVKSGLSMATYKGQIKNEPAANVLSKINAEIQNWKNLDPAEFHTPEGLDALKQRIGGMIEQIPLEQKTALTAANGVYNALKSEINKQAPKYAEVMRGYTEASDTIREIEKALSLGKKASAETSMRKLQSLMRNNVNTSYGYRTKLAEQLEQAGGKEIMPALAGQALNDVIPRGIQRATTGTGGAGLALTGNLPAALALGAVSSPRLVGETLYGAGKVAGKFNPALVKALRKGGATALPVIGANINDE